MQPNRGLATVTCQGKKPHACRGLAGRGLAGHVNTELKTAAKASVSPSSPLLAHFSPWDATGGVVSVIHIPAPIPATGGGRRWWREPLVEGGVGGGGHLVFLPHPPS